jgi:hypothetical protein
MLTFVRQVPHEDYPRLGRGSLPVSAEAAPGQETSVLVATASREVPVEIALAPMTRR